MTKTIASTPKIYPQQSLRSVIALLVVGLLGLTLMPLTVSQSTGPTSKLVMERVAEAPLWQLMPVTGRSTDSMIESLSAAGVPDASVRSSIRSLSGKDPVRESQLLGAVFSDK